MGKPCWKLVWIGGEPCAPSSISLPQRTLCDLDSVMKAVSCVLHNGRCTAKDAAQYILLPLRKLCYLVDVADVEMLVTATYHLLSTTTIACRHMITVIDLNIRCKHLYNMNV